METDMKLKFAVLALTGGLLLAWPSLLFAHHGEAAYDTDKATVVKGCTVTKFVWANPHVFVMCDAKASNGDVQHWVAESGSPSAVTLKNWTRNSMHPGDVITVYVFQSKNGSTVGRLNKIVLANGTELHDSNYRPEIDQNQAYRYN
jgi:Family of unknown function (DUF6152)